MKFLTIYLSCLLVCSSYGVSFSLFSLLLDATGVSGGWVGLNAALPALGWILGSIAVPYLQLRLCLSIKRIALSFLLLSGIGAFVPLIVEGYVGLSLTRFVFGGAMGLFLRCVEYTLVANAPNERRGRYLAVYGATFLIGIVAGSLLQSVLGGGTTGNLLVIVSLMAAGGAVFSRARITDDVWEAPKLNSSAFALVPVLPIAFMGVVAYALYESVPAYFLQIFALRSGASETIAVSTLSAAALGNLCLLLPLLFLSDKLGRGKILAFCAAIAAIAPFGIQSSVEVPTLFLSLIAILGAAAGASYALSLAMLGDRFDGQALVVANAIFGVLYAIGSVVGPLLHGLATELAGPDGLMNSVSVVFTCLLCGVLLTTSLKGLRKRNV